MSVETVKLSATQKWDFKANKEGYEWSWDTAANRYKLKSNNNLVGWFKTLGKVRNKIKELRVIAPLSNLPQRYRDAGYTTSLGWSGSPEKTYRLEFRGEYIGNFSSIDKALEKIIEHDVNRWEKINQEIDAMWKK